MLRMPLSPGDKLGPYELLAPLGAGGMGEVWKARDTRLDRIVAIKRLKQRHSARFQQEARAIAALNHPHICQIFDIGPDYLVLEYIDGKPPRGPLPPEDAVRIGIQIASALEAAHAKNILHRDLKPGNVLLSAAGPKLLDFGIAKLTVDPDATETMAVSGTPLYMSPEQAEGKPLDARSDIFSFGAVLFELLSGQRAFDSLGAVLRDEPARLDSPAADIVKRCLAKQRGDRFQTAAEVRAALETLAARPAVHTKDEQPSIAVLPFANLSSDKEQEYFSDGLAEEILNLLAKIPGLKVIARTSSFAFRGKDQDIRKIGEALDVATVLEGSVRRAGSRIRVTAQLIDSKSGAHLWSDRYDRELTDVFAVQDEVAAAIAGVLRTKLAGQPDAPHQYAPKLPAYEAYLKARYHQWKITPESFARAKEYYEQAIAFDPNFALAYVGYAEWFLHRLTAGGSPQELLPLAREAAQRAVAIDPSVPEANAMMGITDGAFQYDWQKAERWFRLAVAHEPVPPLVRLWHAFFYLAPIGRAREAIKECRIAVQQDPVSVVMRVSYAACLIAGGRFAEAEAEHRQVLEIDPNNVASFGLVGLLAKRGAIAEAVDVAERLCAAAPWFPPATASLAAVLKLAGQAERAENLLQGMDQSNEISAARAKFSFHLISGEPRQAATWLVRLAESLPTFVATLRVVQSLYPGPYWAPVARIMNLPEAPVE